MNGWVVLIWNTRKTSPFLLRYEEFVNWIADENRVKHEDLTDTAISQFLGEYRMAKLDNSQQLDLRGMIGRVLSTSYTPASRASAHGVHQKGDRSFRHISRERYRKIRVLHGSVRETTHLGLLPDSARLGLTGNAVSSFMF